MKTGNAHNAARALLLCLAAGLTAAAQGPGLKGPAPAGNASQASTPRSPAAASAPIAGGVVHGQVKSGSIPLPGVSVTATNTLTGKKYSAATDIAGRYSIAIPLNGRYVIRTEFAAFAPATSEVLIEPATGGPPLIRQVDFSLLLASRSGEENGGSGESRGARRYPGSGAQNLGLIGALAGAVDAGNGAGLAGASLPSMSSSPDFSSDSIAVNGAAGSTNPFAGIDIQQLRDNAQLNRSLSGNGGPGGGGRGGFGGPGGGGGGRRFGNFRNFKPNQPHGAFYWDGGNNALNAEPFSIRGQAIRQPSAAQNQFGLTYFGAPYIPVVLKHDSHDMLFFNLSGQRSSNPFDQYGTVPTAAERTGNLSQLTTESGQLLTIYDPRTGRPFPNNIIPSARVAPQARALLSFIPLPNQPGAIQNYLRLTSEESNLTRFGLRFIHTFGSAAGGSPLIGLLRQYLGQGGPGWSQNINANFNYLHQAADELNLFPELGGKTQMHQYSLQLGYSLGKGRLTNNFTGGWNRTDSQNSNYFTGVEDIASQIGLAGLPSNPLVFGLPNLTLNQFTGVNEQQPNFEINQTISFSESSAWIHGKHNFRFGGDIRRVDLNLFGDTANATGTYTFTGLFTERPGASGNAVSATSGSSLADLLLGLPQQTSLQAPYQTSYLRENIWDLYAQDDWRARSNLTFLYGLRYEYFSPYSEKNNRLATLDTGNDFASVATVVSNGVGPFTGKFPRDLVYPERDDFSPRVGFAWRPIQDTVLRGGYGINFTVGQYVKFVQDFAFEPPFADVQTNEVASVSQPQFSLANGFPAPQSEGNYAVNKYYRLPYVQVWNLNLQRTIPGSIVLNIGYNGSKGSDLDMVDAPGRTATASLSGVLYDYEDSTAFSNYNALTVSAQRRLHSGIALSAFYTYSHSIDDASSIGGNGGTGLTVVQNWQNPLAEESNSSFDIRHQVNGTFLYELPFGPDTHLLTTGWAGRAASGLSVSGTYDFATGKPLTPAYAAAVNDVSRGSTGSLRPDRVRGIPLRAGGTLTQWFNPAAFAPPAEVYGTASRFSVPGPGTVSVNMSLSKTVRFAETRTFEMRATSTNIFNTVQYAGVDTTLGSATYGQVTSTANMRQFTFIARFRY